MSIRGLSSELVERRRAIWRARKARQQGRDAWIPPPVKPLVRTGAIDVRQRVYLPKPGWVAAQFFGTIR